MPEESFCTLAVSARVALVATDATPGETETLMGPLASGTVSA